MLFRRFSPALLVALFVPACVTAPPPVAANRLGVDRAVAASTMQAAAAQVRRCYRSPRLPRAARQIATRLRVRFGPDGSLLGLPTVAGQAGVTPENQFLASAMARAAIEAVVTCAPLRLPSEQHQSVWSDFELTFSPGAAA